MVCSFCGHSSVAGEDLVYEKLLREVRKLACLGVDEFYSGGYGEFDTFALRAVFEVQKDYPRIKNIIVVPYITENHLSKYEYLLEKYNAITIYPFETKVLQRFAILKRNEWMMDHSDFILCYITHNWGGAYIAYEYSRKKNKTIINLAKHTK